MIDVKCLAKCPSVCEARSYIGHAQEQRRASIEIMAGMAALQHMTVDEQVAFRKQMDDSNNPLEVLRELADEGKEHIVSFLATMPFAATSYFEAMDATESLIGNMEASVDILVSACPDGPAEYTAADGLTDVRCNSKDITEAAAKMQKH